MGRSFPRNPRNPCTNVKSMQQRLPSRFHIFVRLLVPQAKHSKPSRSTYINPKYAEPHEDISRHNRRSTSAISLLICARSPERSIPILRSSAAAFLSCFSRSWRRTSNGGGGDRGVTESMAQVLTSPTNAVLVSTQKYIAEKHSRDVCRIDIMLSLTGTDLLRLEQILSSRPRPRYRPRARFFLPVLPSMHSVLSKTKAGTMEKRKSASQQTQNPRGVPVCDPADWGKNTRSIRRVNVGWPTNPLACS